MPATLPPIYNPAWADPAELPSSSELFSSQGGSPEPSLPVVLNRKHRLANGEPSSSRDTPAPMAPPQVTKGGVHYEALLQNILS